MDGTWRVESGDLHMEEQSEEVADWEKESEHDPDPNRAMYRSTSDNRPGLLTEFYDFVVEKSEMSGGQQSAARRALPGAQCCEQPQGVGVYATQPPRPAQQSFDPCPAGIAETAAAYVCGAHSGRSACRRPAGRSPATAGSIELISAPSRPI